MKKPVVLCTLPLHAAGLKLLDGVAEVVLAPDTRAQTLYRMIGEADIVLVRSQLPADLFDRPNRLIGVIRNGTGLDLIPVEAATRHGIPVANVPGANVQTVAEYCVSAMLAMTRSRPPHCRQVSMSMPNTRLRRCAQVRFGEQSTVDVAPCGLAGWAAPGCVLGTIRARSGLAGANTPWYRVRWARGLGTSAARRAPSRAWIGGSSGLSGNPWSRTTSGPLPCSR